MRHARLGTGWISGLLGPDNTHPDPFTSNGSGVLALKDAMRRSPNIAIALVVALIRMGCGWIDNGVAGKRTGILFINEFFLGVDISIDGCDQFHLPGRQGGVFSRYTARGESTEDTVWTVRAYAE